MILRGLPELNRLCSEENAFALKPAVACLTTASVLPEAQLPAKVLLNLHG
jgi:hypothetical protein